MPLFSQFLVELLSEVSFFINRVEEKGLVLTLIKLLLIEQRVYLNYYIVFFFQNKGLGPRLLKDLVCCFRRCNESRVRNVCKGRELAVKASKFLL